MAKTKKDSGTTVGIKIVKDPSSGDKKFFLKNAIQQELATGNNLILTLQGGTVKNPPSDSPGEPPIEVLEVNSTPVRNGFKIDLAEPIELFFIKTNVISEGKFQGNYVLKIPLTGAFKSLNKKTKKASAKKKSKKP